MRGSPNSNGASGAWGRLTNTVARTVTLTAKFFLLFVLARFLTAEEVALYGLLVATVAYSLLLAGLDFYTYSTRELLSGSPVSVMKNQLALAVVVHAALAPVLSILFLTEALPWSVVWWFFPLLWLEHLSQEINRLLVTISDQLAATAILFLRMAAWVVLVVIAMYVRPDARHIGFLLGAWLVGVSLACVAGALRVRRQLPQDWSAPLDRVWILKGIRVALPMLLGTLALRFVFTADRYWVGASLGSEVLAAYVLFAGVASGLTTVLDAGVFSYSYPALVRLHHTGRRDEFRILLRRVGAETFTIVAVYSVAAWLALDYLLSWIGNAAYQRVDGLFPWLMLALALQSLSLPFHFALYAMNRDRQLILSQVAGALAFVATASALTAAGFIAAVPAAVAVCFSVVLLAKVRAYLAASGSGQGA